MANVGFGHELPKFGDFLDLRGDLKAVEEGVTDFVVPGNKVNEIISIRKMLEEKGITPTFYSPGLVTQGGKISDAGQVAGKRWHAIIGRGIYQAEDMKKAAIEHSQSLTDLEWVLENVMISF